MGLSTVSQNLNAIWQDYLKHLAFAMRNLNMIIDSPIIISGYLAPYLVPEDLNMLLHLINENNPFTLTADQLLVGTHGQYTPAIGAALHYINRFVHEGTAHLTRKGTGSLQPVNLHFAHFFLRNTFLKPFSILEYNENRHGT